MTVEAPLEWTSGSMVPAGFAAVCAEIAARTRPVVVECGCGFSTLALARLLYERGGTLLSIEHDATWAGRVRGQLAAAGLAGTAQVVLAPLEPHPLARDGLGWYALGAMPARIDVLLVDGPPAFEPEMQLSRYPALPALAGCLAPDAVVILDDVDRAGELQVLAAWERECGFRFEIRPAERIGFGRRAWR